MQEAVDGAGEPRYASPLAYRHYLAARMAEAGDELPRAVEELKQALVTKQAARVTPSRAIAATVSVRYGSQLRLPQ